MTGSSDQDGRGAIWRRALLAIAWSASTAAWAAVASPRSPPPPGPPFSLAGISPNPGTTADNFTVLLQRNPDFGCVFIRSETQVRIGNVVRITHDVIPIPCPPNPDETLAIPISGSFAPGSYMVAYETPGFGGFQIGFFQVNLPVVEVPGPRGAWLVGLALFAVLAGSARLRSRKRA